MGTARNWFGIVRTKFFASSKTITIRHTSPSFLEEPDVTGAAHSEELNVGVLSCLPSAQQEDLTEIDMAAIKIQATFRGHLVKISTHSPPQCYPFSAILSLVNVFNLAAF